MDNSIYSRVLFETENSQIRLTVSEWGDIEYLHIRKYYMDFEGLWLPSKDGISMPLEIDNVQELFAALVELLSLAESKSILEEHFKEILDEIYVCK